MQFRGDEMSTPKPAVKPRKLGLWARRWSAAPQLTIRRQLSARARLLLGIGVLLGVGAVAFGSYDLGRRLTGGAVPVNPAQLATIKDEVAKLSAERDQYSSTVNSAESQLNIERSAQRQLAAQVKILETENSKLKEDLAFFESLLPADKAAGGVSIRRLKADMTGANQLRYRVLVMQGGKGDRDFNGSLQLAVTVLQAGKSAIIIFPQTGTQEPAAAEKFHLEFKRYQRLDGLLTLPDGAELRSVQARILEKGQIRVQQTTIPERAS